MDKKSRNLAEDLLKMFPDFDPKWTDQLKLKWFESFVKLVHLDKKEERWYNLNITKEVKMRLRKDFSVKVLARLQSTVWDHLAFFRDPISGAIEVKPNIVA